MEKCPKCGRWTVELDLVRGALICHRFECDYEKHVDVDKYISQHDVLPILAKSLPLNGYK